MAEQDTVIDPGAPLEPKKSGKGKKSAPGVEMDSAEVLLQVLEKATPEQRDRVSKYLGKSDDSFLRVAAAVGSSSLMLRSVSPLCLMATCRIQIQIICPIPRKRCP